MRWPHTPSQPKGRGMAVEHGDDAAVARQRRQQPLDVPRVFRAATIAAYPARRGPAGMQTVRRGDRQHFGRDLTPLPDECRSRGEAKAVCGPSGRLLTLAVWTLSGHLGVFLREGSSQRSRLELFRNRRHCARARRS